MRLHLFEWEDQAWFPRPLRAAMTSYLGAAYGATPLPRMWADRLSHLMSMNAVNEIVDLGSGSGGPVGLVLKELKGRGFRTSVTLTDLYPNQNTLGFCANEIGPVRYWPEPVDALKLPPALSGIRTMFASFHHFRPQAAREILRDAFEQRRPIAIFEGTTRTAAGISSAVLIPLLVLVLTPRVRRLSWVQILFTYLIPILPLLIFWDGLVSQLRTYSVQELRGLTCNFESSGYRWEAGLIEAPRILGVPYLIGWPVEF